MAEGNAATGKFVWHDLMTTDVDKAVAFYTGLLGWTLNEVDMGPMGKYKMIHAGGADRGGIVPLDPGHGLPSHWVMYVTVDDVDATARKAAEIGGQAPEPGFDIPNIGRMAVVLDPHGAVISPFKSVHPASGEEPAGPPPAGTFCWYELLAVDPEAEAAFYRDLFGWGTGSMDMGPMGTYHLFKQGDKEIAGALQKPEGSGPSVWVPYIAVEDVDASTAKARELGATVHVEPKDIPNIGRFSVASDPTGALVAFFRA